MKIVIPYKDYRGPELKYTLRGIEKYIEDPEVTVIGDFPKWLDGVTYIPFKDDPKLQFKERNIFQKLLLVDHDFLFFNDDHFLLEPFYKNTYHYSGMLREDILELGNSFRQTIKNTLDLYGVIPNYFRHSPIFVERDKLEKLTARDWEKPWGYCVKSIYCRVNNIKGTDYPDLKIRTYLSEHKIKNLIAGRPYFSTGNNAINSSMIKVLNDLYPTKSRFEQ